METVSRILLTFLLNAVWQVPMVCAIAALACRVMSKGPAGHRHAVWVAALAAAILLPVASIRTADQSPTPQYSVALVAPDAPVKSAPALPARAPVALPPAPARTISFAETTVSVLIGCYLLVLLYRIARLGRASLRTARIRGAAHAAPIPQLMRRVWSRCEQAFGVKGAELLFSAQIPGPVTAGRAIILPESLLAEMSEDVISTAIGHEMAHIARHDFVSNFLYELLHLPIGFHPAAWLIRRGLERTREVACDELVTNRLMDPGVYARSIMSIATAMTALPQPGYTLGVFDGDILEERIRRLVERPAANLKRARLLLVTGLSGLAICAVIASSLALTARAQGGAYALMKQAEAAYNRGDLQGATALFETAIQVEPANLKAKLLLANVLLQQYIPGTDASNPLVARARQQLLDVLAHDPNNKQALQ